VVDEDEIQRSAGEAAFCLEPCDRGAPVAERPDQHRQLLTDPGVIPNTACDRRIVGVELDRHEPRTFRHHPRGAKGTVAAVGPELEQLARLAPPDRRVEDLALLVADIDQEAAVIRKVIDDADHIVEVALTGLFLDVTGERQLSPVAHLPLGRQAPHAKQHAHHRPAKERKSLPAELRQR
jgi:hypothetical protein